MEIIGNQELHLVRTPEINKALDDLTRLIADNFPGTTFDVLIGLEPVGFYLTVSLVDFDQALEVLAVIGDRQYEIQVDEELPVYVDLTEQRLHATPESTAPTPAATKLPIAS